MALSGLHRIAGQACAAAAPRFHGIDATTQARLEPGYPEATPEEIDSALRKAAGAFEVLAAANGETRAALLEAIAREIETLGDGLLARAHAETGLPLARLTGERGRTCAQLRLFAQVAREGSWVDARIDPALPQRQPLPRPDLRRMLQPIGPVVVFGASNFPLAFSVAGGDTASALATGNPVVVKAHPAHPGTSELVADAVDRAVAACGLPAGTFSLLHGREPRTGLDLVRHPDTCAVGFTGSHTAGRALFDAAAARPRPIPVFAEMSSLNPVFLLSSALAARGSTIAEGLKQSFTLGVGQFCTKPGVVIGVASPAWNAFAARLGELARSVPAGTMLHAGIAGAFAESTADLRDVEWLSKGPAAAARVSAARFLDDPTLHREIFGPFTLLVTVPDAAGLTSFARALDGQLTATVHGDADDLSAPATADLLRTLGQRAGRIVLNGFPTGVEVAPAMQHGGPYPSTTDSRFTSVGTAALARFVRPVCYQDFPDSLRPPALQDANPLGLMRLVNGAPTRATVGTA
jgi:NADP-dependent aldehyde dehydrogenase